MTTSGPRLQYLTDQLRASARRALRRRAPDLETRAFVFSVIGQSSGHIEFHLVYGGFMSARSYWVECGDDDRAVDETIDRALADLRLEMAAATAVEAETTTPGSASGIGLTLDAAIAELNGQPESTAKESEPTDSGGKVIDLTERLRTTTRERASRDLVAGDYLSETVVVMGLVGIAVNEYLATLPPNSFERRRLTSEIEKRARSIAVELDARRYSSRQ